jgi:hypothetical protein
MIDGNDLHALALHMIGRHGPEAVGWADKAVAEMDALGDVRRGDAWRALRDTIADLVGGRVDPYTPVTVH